MREVTNHLPGRLELCRITPLLVKKCFAVIYEFRSVTVLRNTFSSAAPAKRTRAVQTAPVTLNSAELH